MNKEQLDTAEQLVEFVKTARTGHGYNKRLLLLLRERRMPDKGWNQCDVEMLLRQLAMLDSNNFAVGLGEREGRVYSSLVSNRSFGLSHGMGRSGSLADPQPKAAGSSLLVTLTNALARDVLVLGGDSELKRDKEVLVLPVATGMGLFLCLMALKRSRPAPADHIVWLRCDQSSAPKAVELAGAILVPVNPRLDGESLVTDLEALKAAIDACGGPDRVLCILSTTSCFAPRVPDDIEAIGRLCLDLNVPHLLNNAYGTQSPLIMSLIARTRRVGRLDAYVQSTDKNYCVPVGGSIVAGPLAEAVGEEYSGRASSQPLIDLFITLLSMGRDGYRNLILERERLFVWFRERIAEVEGLRLLDTWRRNPISLALALDPAYGNMLGSMLFTRGVTGHRLVGRTDKITVKGGAELQNWGQHCNRYEPCERYLNVAVAILAQEEELLVALKALEKSLREIRKKNNI